MQIVPKKSENETIYCLQSIQTDCLFVKQNKKIRIKENENNVQTARERIPSKNPDDTCPNMILFSCNGHESGQNETSIRQLIKNYLWRRHPLNNFNLPTTTTPPQPPLLYSATKRLCLFLFFDDRQWISGYILQAEKLHGLNTN